MAAIVVRGLEKHYGDVAAVRGIDFEVAAGEVFAILGPNGAGKTTTVEILEGHRRRTAGSVEVLGIDPEKAERDFRERIGIVLQNTAVEKELTVREAIELYGGMYEVRRPTTELIDLVGLDEKADARVKTLSGGQQRRLELALGMVGDPDLLFLDEPTTGFDPSARRQAWTVIENLTALGKTILLTTHYMDEAQHLADRVVVMRNGVIVAEGAPDELGGRANLSTHVSFVLEDGSGVVAIPGDPESIAGRYVVAADDVTATLFELTGWALAHRVELLDLTVDRPSLEDVYLALTAEDDDD